ncbi:MAG: O-antigen ligase family protein [Promethearchaeota archaeon]
MSKIFPQITTLIFPLFLSIFVLIFLLFQDIKKFITFLYKKELKIWFIFIILAFASLLWTPNPKYGLFKFQIFIIRAVLPGLAIYFSYIYFKKLNWIPVIISGLLYIIFFFFTKETYAYSTHRMTIEGGNPIWVARTVLLFVSICLLVINSIILKIFLAFLGIITAFMAQSKGPLLSVFIAITFYYLKKYLKKTNDYKHSIILIIKAFILITIILIIITFLFNNISILKNSRLFVIFDIKKIFSDINVLDRIVRIIRAINIYFKNILFGAGLGGFSKFDTRSYPHNIILEIACELGSVGLIVWSIAIFLTYKLAYTDNFLFFLFTQSFFYSFFSGDLGFNYEYIIFSFLTFALVDNRYK